MNITKQYLNDLAIELFEKWGIQHWSFGWNNRKRSWGVCKYREERIELSRWIFDNTHDSDKAKFVDTLKHEIAHALAGGRNGHNRVWRAWARKVGAVPVASESHKAVDPNKGVKWVLVDTSNNDKIVARYFRKPPASRMARVATFSLRGRPQSLGKLKYRKL